MIDLLGGGIWTLGAFIVALSIIVAIHEYGHYIVGRWSGIKADVFSIGFGPKLISRRDRRGTLWQVAAIPLGGYVRFKGDSNAASAGASVQAGRDTLDGAPLWARAATVAAGPVFNFVLSAVIFTGFALAMGKPSEVPTIGTVHPAPPSVQMMLQAGDRVTAVGGQPVATWPEFFQAVEANPEAAPEWTVERGGVPLHITGPVSAPARIADVGPGGAAARAGLRAGDVILSIDGNPITRFDEIRPAVEAAAGAPIALEVWRAGVERPLSLSLTPREQDLPRAEGGFERRWLIGVTGGTTYFEPATESIGPLEAMRLGASRVWSVISSSLTGMWAMITGQIDSCNLGGAITIAESTGQAASQGGQNFLWWIAILSVAIGFINLLPIPVLDGGHLAFYAYEAVAGRRPPERVVNILSMIGLAMVLGLMFFGLTNDLRCR
ncbi:MAG: RIP metalloprotease RseP [Paracoccus sp. (in: a-proteobacteria)]|nr:RIP metalloprotease RseP [Paracoccus sp. (in: a-proteobacteria)]